MSSYTIGHRQAYLKSICKHGQITKLGVRYDYPGGWIFKSCEDARQFLMINGYTNYAIWEIDCEFENNSYCDSDGVTHLINDALIVGICDG